MRKTMLWSIAIGLVAVSGASPPNRPFVPALQDIPECPHDWVKSRKVEGIPQQVRSWPTLAVPEFNDCQRFILVRGGARRYTNGLFAIFAHPQLDSLEERLETVASCPLGCPEAQRASVLTSAEPAAFIYADRSYPELSIAAGSNCLFLYRNGSRWRARMVPIFSNDSNTCTVGVDPSDGVGYELLVRDATAPGLMLKDDYPPVARWDWDFNAKEHYIGIKCGAAWCEVGNLDGFEQSKAHPEAAEFPLNRFSRRSVEIKGWYDEQYLAVYEMNELVPSNILGTFFPDKDLGSDDIDQDGVDDEDDFRTWNRVARVAIEAPASPTELDLRALQVYDDKFGFVRTELGEQLNEIWLCDASLTEGGCPEVPAVVPAACLNAPGQVDGRRWWARIRSANDPPDVFRKYVCIIGRRAEDQTLYIPGTVRWRWALQDEGGWIRCEQGCCEMPGGLG